MGFFKRIIIAVGLTVYCCGVFASCLDADRLEFRQIDPRTFLVSRDGKNIAILTLYNSSIKNISQNDNTWEFFTPKICDSGANADFMLNGKRSSILAIEIFRK